MRVAAMALVCFLIGTDVQAESLGAEQFSQSDFAPFDNDQLDTVSDFESAISGFLSDHDISAPDAFESEMAQEAHEHSMNGASESESIGDLFSNRYTMRLITDSSAADLYVDDQYYERVASERYLVYEGTRVVRVELGTRDCKRSVVISRHGANKMECNFGS
jgi:hypothetical protein